MMFRQLEYQDRVLTTLDTYTDHLTAKKQESDEIAELAASRPQLAMPIPDFTKRAWEALKAKGKLPESRTAIPFSPRKDGCGRPVPNAVLKVPTGGGKTWLAVSGVSRIMGRYLGRNIGFVLWIVPNEAIYRQTLKHLRDRQHPYRQALDRAAAGRVRIMEKIDRLDARDVETNLCVMLLMLQSANRETQESLKMFQDRGDVHGFFPPEGEQQAHREALERTPNLAAYEGMLFPMVKDSLGNALRIIRPVVVLDEGHRAISDLAFKTLYGFNPCFVLELTATPRDVQPRGGRSPRHGRYANLLVEVTGRELDREGMIKIPLNIEPRQGTDWRATLNAALTKLNTLHAEAKRLRADTNRYIRPINRRDAFASTEIYLPKVMVLDGAQVRELDYETDVLSRIDWRGFDPENIAARIPENAQAADAQLRRIRLTEEGDELFVGETVAGSGEVLAFDPAHAVRMMLDIVPNPFVGREIVGRLLDALRGCDFDDRKLGGIARLVVEEMRNELDRARDARAEALFKDAVAAGRIQFRLRLDGRNWRMPFQTDTTEPADVRQLVSRNGGPLEKSLFAPVYESEFNRDESEVAVYLDGEEALTWWHRNVARTQYGIQGWKKGKIYPDFIFAVQADGATNRITVLETKGDQLDNLDTAYKREVLSFLSSSFAWDDCTPAGELELITDNGHTVQCTLILMSEWKTKLPHFLDGRAG